MELAVCEVLGERGVIPPGDLEQIRARASFDLEAVKERERVTDHDVAAFVDVVAQSVGDAGRWIHYGLTSSDVLDTGLALQLREAGRELEAGAAALTDVLVDRAREFRDTLCAGRTHGVHAEPTTFGLKLAGFAFESDRSARRLRAAFEQVAVGKLSGAVGTYSALDPDVEREVLARLDLSPEPLSTQVVPRDRHAELLNAVALAGASLERLALEIRHLQRTEVREVEEPFKEGQKGSSAMPHKRNPITCERIAGLARVLRGNAIAGLEDVALWHERDISHSSTERVILPDSTILLDYMQNLMHRVVEGMRRACGPHAGEPRAHARRDLQPDGLERTGGDRPGARRGLPDRPAKRAARLGRAAARSGRCSSRTRLSASGSTRRGWTSCSTTRASCGICRSSSSGSTSSLLCGARP